MCKLKIPDPSKLKYDTSTPIQIQCMCNAQRSEHKENCYFYHEEIDMCARIHTCNYYFELGYCPCEDCDKYFDKRKVYDTVKKIVDERGE